MDDPYPSRSAGLTRRTSAQKQAAAAAPPPRSPVHVDVDPPPKARPIFQVLSFALIALFSALQFLPATHFRDPSDPFRGPWIPVDNNVQVHADHQDANGTGSTRIGGSMHVASWIDCLDLRVLAVLVNSTLTSSRYPANIYFHFFLPGSTDEKKSFYKLKVLFPDANIDIIGQQEIKEKLAKAIPEIKNLWPIPPGLAPFVIPKINPSLRIFAFMPPLSIVKESIDELFTIDTGGYAIAAIEDCSKRLHDQVNIEVVQAIQRTAAKDWISKVPYDGNACLPELNILLLDAARLEKNLIKAILWWNAVLGENLKSDKFYPSIVLAFANRFLKLSPSWKLGGTKESLLPNNTHVFHFDGPRTHCSESLEQLEIAGFGNNWRQHISAKSELILGH